MEDKRVRNVQIIGNLWPRCETCGHIAQAHDPGVCTETTSGKCPSCGEWKERVPCTCTEYKGPTLEEFMRDYMTPTEREHYTRVWHLNG